MIKIVICDDEKENISELKKYIADYKDVDIYEYTSAEELLESKEIFDIAFLDIEMEKYNGFDIAQYIYNKNNNCIISFYSNYSQYAIKGYKYHIYRYILKDEPEIIKKELISEIFEEYGTRCKSIEIKRGKDNILIQLHDIYYIESLRKLIVLHTRDQEFCCYNSLKHFENESSQYSFVRIHKSFIVNTHKIRSVTLNKELELDNGKVLPIGRKYSERLKRMI